MDKRHENVSVCPEYGDTKQTAKILNVSCSYLNKARICGNGPPFCKFGAAVRYHIPTAMAWAASLTQRSTSENAGKGA